MIIFQIDEICFFLIHFLLKDIYKIFQIIFCVLQKKRKKKCINLNFKNYILNFNYFKEIKKKCYTS
jgi:hypothetical protein